MPRYKCSVQTITFVCAALRPFEISSKTKYGSHHLTVVTLITVYQFACNMSKYINNIMRLVRLKLKDL